MSEGQLIPYHTCALCGHKMQEKWMKESYKDNWLCKSTKNCNQRIRTRFKYIERYGELPVRPE